MEKALVRSLAQRRPRRGDLLTVPTIRWPSPSIRRGNVRRRCSARGTEEGGLLGAPEVLLAASAFRAWDAPTSRGRFPGSPKAGRGSAPSRRLRNRLWGRLMETSESVPSGLALDGLVVPRSVRARPRRRQARGGSRTVMMTGRPSWDGGRRGPGGRPAHGRGAVLDASSWLRFRMKPCGGFRAYPIVARVAPLDKLRIAGLFQMGGIRSP